MPAQRRAGGVLVNQALAELPGFDTHPLGQALAHGEQKCRDWIGVLQRLLREVIASAAADDAAAGVPVPVLRFLERKCCELPQKLSLVGLRQEVGAIDHSVRQIRLNREKAALFHRGAAGEDCTNIQPATASP